MGYAIVGICLLVTIVIGLTVFPKSKNRENDVLISSVTDIAVSPVTEMVSTEEFEQESILQIETLPTEAFFDESRLFEITDSKVLAHVNNLVPGLAQAGNAVNNAVQTARETGETLYRVLIPTGAKLSDSKTMEGAVRGIYHGTDGINGHANLVAVKTQEGTAVAANTVAAAMGVTSMIVGQYYMTQIHAELGVISNGISKISSFQDNEYRSKVFSLIAHVEIISDFQIEIIENNDLRLTKISQLDSLEEECTQLLGQANLTLAEFAERTNLDYKEYEKALGDAHNWFMYQTSLLDILYKISELRYTLYLGAISRSQCMALLPTYTKQVNDTQEKLTCWHEDTIKRLKIDTAEARRKREGIDWAVHLLPGLFNDNFNFRAIEKSTAEMIASQAAGHGDLHHQDTTDLYARDVYIIAKNGKIYYLPESEN